MCRQVILVFDIYTHKIGVYRAETKVIDSITGESLYETNELYPKRQIAGVAAVEKVKIKDFLINNDLQVVEKKGNAAGIRIPDYLMVDEDSEELIY